MKTKRTTTELIALFSNIGNIEFDLLENKIKFQFAELLLEWRVVASA